LTKVRKTFFIPASVVEAYRDWKTFWGLQAPAAGAESRVIQETPNQGLAWSARWGITQIEGQAEFIPAQGGCVMYLGLDGVGTFSRLLLAPVLPLSWLLWRSVERFQPSAVERRWS
jgi:hypothetical protein